MDLYTIDHYSHTCQENLHTKEHLCQMYSLTEHSYTEPRWGQKLQGHTSIQCRKLLAQPAIRHIASLVLLHWNQNRISQARDLTAVFAIDHTPVELHYDWLQTAMPRHLHY